ncbi:ThiF family adenylyltransferase [Bradyrhizobium elkanii]|uniref:ThiF family adenylyltransferase n=1 Tax=Bradyrhizobium elkanii TaxID=29448 RepID=UPI00216A63DE|nr:ThiF family adenylyltransferase [Bradyrhizobium elkanii]MCS3519232.1 ubiquitin-protein ligase [Bradyrhizobium elkanii]MCS4066890.1 ubiquitin-protein ligase [Bradyrhizobium elkanii]MCS4082425.1 ubiquitin-protein ligase [Bradyrhizobium elkanii]MCW2127961.1 ubiquitin-protein ligase [Bradyrhizobium elkanii]MCW2174702.1 ubiquitin-protein ligase [Bradyrhizobium elkanii]
MHDRSAQQELAPQWDLRFPGRLQMELDAFKAENVDPKPDKDALKDGRLVLDFEWPYGGDVLSLRAVYPDGYPFLRPQVLLREPGRFSGRRHVAPDGTICLIGRESRQWTSSLTVPALLTEKLADALKAVGNEDPQGEPPEVWWNGRPIDDLPFCLIETTWDLWTRGLNSGQLTVRYTFDDSSSDAPLLRAAVTRVLSEDGVVLAHWNSRLPAFLAGDNARELTIPWERLDQAPFPDSGDTLRDLVGSVIAASSPIFPLSRLSKRQFRLNAFLYPSELGWQQKGDGWLFALAEGTKKGFQLRRSVKGGAVRTLRAGPSDLLSRAPQASAMCLKKVCLIGTGAIGAPVAIDLARNGIKELRLLDFDILEPGNSVRWPLGASAWGRSKVEALEAFIKNEFPYCDVHTIKHQLGSQSEKYPFRDERALADAIEGVDLVIDATAAYWNIAFIHDFVAQRGLPLMAMHASPPVTGGIVVLYGPDGGCPACLLRAWRDGSIIKPPGVGDESGLVQPPGCSERTFTGVSYDLQELSLQAMRVASTFLAAGRTNSSTAVYTLSFDAESGVRLPSWHLDILDRHATCTCNA